MNVRVIENIKQAQDRYKRDRDKYIIAQVILPQLTTQIVMVGMYAKINTKEIYFYNYTNAKE